MKHKMSISVDEELVLDIFYLMRKKNFRNKSRVVEYAIKKII